MAFMRHTFKKVGEIEDGRADSRGKTHDAYLVRLGAQPLSANLTKDGWDKLQTAAKRKGFYVLSVFNGSVNATQGTFARTEPRSLPNTARAFQPK